MRRTFAIAAGAICLIAFVFIQSIRKDRHIDTSLLRFSAKILLPSFQESNPPRLYPREISVTNGIILTPKIPMLRTTLAFSGAVSAAYVEAA